MRTALSSLAAAMLGVLPAFAAADGVPAPGRSLDVTEFEIRGSTQLPTGTVEAAVTPFLGPGRGLEDVEGARAALERAYTERGFHSVAVAVPPQTVRGGVVVLEVTEGRVGRLRVRGTRWFSPWDVKRLAPSVAEGAVPNFDRIVEDILLLNQIPDRRVTPALRAGSLPGTVDVDLDVEETFPLHGSLEFNNRHGRDTKPERVAGSLHYDNLWQAGNSLSFDFQFAPQSNDQRALFYARPYPDARVFTGSYLLRIPGVSWFTATASATYQDSAVTSPAVTVEGTGRLGGLKATFTLPGSGTLFHTVSLTPGYREMGQVIKVEARSLSAPIVYWPLAAEYAATWSEAGTQLQGTLGVTVSLRALGSDPARFDDRRYKASAAFVNYRADFSLTRDLPAGWRAWAMLQGQYAPDPLIPSEQFSAGGADTVRGYLTSEAVGDLGALGSVELRTPSLIRLRGEGWLREWRWHAFADGAWAAIHEPLPQTPASYHLASVGAGTRLKLVGHLAANLDLALPLRAEGITGKYRPRLHFRLWAEI